MLIVTLEVLQPHVPAVMPSLNDDRLAKYCNLFTFIYKKIVFNKVFSVANHPKEEELKKVGHEIKKASGDNKNK